VNIPNEKLSRCLLYSGVGVVSDKDIITMCLLDIYSNMMDAFVPSIHDASIQQAAIKYIATFTKGKTESYVLEILSDFSCLISAR
jgi:hypothetical protein